MMSKMSILCVLGFVLGSYPSLSQSLEFPREYWEMYSKPGDAGFDEVQLAEIKKQFEKQGGSTLFVVQDGKVVVSWGAPERRYMQASIRKSYLSALYGIFEEKGLIDLEQNLESLKVDDIQALTKSEKEAKIIDLLRAKSGIYLPAAYSPAGMAKLLPERGSHSPGEFWYYNNWDFNVLSTIFKQQTDQDLFNAFQSRIAEPLQMEDFRLSDTHYRYEKDKSIHPAYLFKMSARDMARFGLLFLRRGKWGKSQLIPADWVQESTRVHTANLGPKFGKRGGYGLLWWIAPPLEGNSLYYAAGSGGQRIYVIPEQDMVIVHLVDTYQNRSVGQEAVQSLIKHLLQAKTGAPQPQALFTKLVTTKPTKAVTLELAAGRKVSGEYTHPFLKKISIVLEDKDLFLRTRVGKFRLFPTADDRYLIEDIRIPIVFQLGSTEQKGKSRSVINDQRKVEQIIFYH